MKKKLTVMSFLLCTTLLVAQEIKTKGNRVLIDGKEVAHISDKKRVYTFSDLTDVAKFSLVQKFMTFTDGSSGTWYVVTDLSTNKTNEALDESLAIGLSYEKNLVTNFVLGKNKLITTNGIDEKLLQEFTSGPQTLISEEMAGRNVKIESDKKAAEDFFVTSNLYIANDGAIYKSKDLMGRIIKTFYDNPNFPDVIYTIYDKNNIVLAVWHKSGGVHPKTGYSLRNEMLTTLDKRVFSLKPDFFNQNTSLDKDPHARALIAKLLINGYKFGEQMLEAKTQAVKENYEEAKAKSVNIYEANGYVINENKEKLEGKITALFQEVKNPDAFLGTEIATYGKEITFELANGVTKIYRSKKNIKFCVQTPNGEECYLGLKTIGNSAEIGGSINTLSFDFSKFYKIIYDKNGNMILVDAINKQDFIIKIANQEKGLFTNKSDANTLKKNFIEYTNCQELVFENFDFKTKEGLIKMIEEYLNKCSK